MTRVKAPEASIPEVRTVGSMWLGAAERSWSPHRRDVQSNLQPQEYVGERAVVVAERRPFEVRALTWKALSDNAERKGFCGPEAAESRLSGRRWLAVEMALAGAGPTM